MSTTPQLKTRGRMESIEPHRAAHSQRKRDEAEWRKNRTTGFMRVHSEVTINDGEIARITNKKFYELKSFGQTLHWSLDKAKVMAAYEATAHTFIEEREIIPGRVERIEVTPRHLTVWEFNPETGQKWRIK